MTLIVSPLALWCRTVNGICQGAPMYLRSVHIQLLPCVIHLSRSGSTLYHQSTRQPCTHQKFRFVQSFFTLSPGNWLLTCLTCFPSHFLSYLCKLYDSVWKKTFVEDSLSNYPDGNWIVKYLAGWIEIVLLGLCQKKTFTWSGFLASYGAVSSCLQEQTQVSGGKSYRTHEGAM